MTTMIPLEIYIVTVLIAATIPFYFWRKERQRAKYYKAGKSYWKQTAKSYEQKCNSLHRESMKKGEYVKESDERLNGYVKFVQALAESCIVQTNCKQCGRLVKFRTNHFTDLELPKYCDKHKIQ